MKNILTLLFLVCSFNVFSQTTDCKLFTVMQVDEVTGDTIHAAKKRVFLKDMETLQAMSFDVYKAPKSSLIISIKTVGLKSCIDEGNKINILFIDGTRMELQNHQDFNCEGEFAVYISDSFDNEEAVHLLSSKEIKTIRLHDSKHNSIQLSPNATNRASLKNIIACLKDK